VLLEKRIFNYLNDFFTVPISPVDNFFVKLPGSEASGIGAIQMPSVYHLLPHLLRNADSLKPAYRMSKSRIGGTILQ
jgi:hypothetical protein